MNNSARQLIVVHGPTAVGKTGVSVELARILGAEIISCDSRQFYREMTVGTAVPTAAELAAAPHHFIQDRSVTTPVTAGSYETEALARLEEIFQRTPTAIMVGGSGLYAKAVTEGLDEIPGDTKIRERLTTNTLEENLKLLLQLDSATHNTIDHDNSMRVQRAVEACLASGKPYSSLRSGAKKPRSFRIIELALNLPREELYRHIEERVDTMLKLQLETEAVNLFKFRHLPPLQTVGYREFFEHFEGRISRSRAVELIKQNTRHYAKRQLTWLRGQNPDLKYFSPTQLPEMQEHIETYAPFF